MLLMNSYALLFPGQGSQYVGMGKSIFESSLGAILMEEAEDLLSLPLRRLMLEGPKSELTNTSIAQPAILLHSYAVLKTFEENHSFTITSTLGHSLGEYTALVAAGVLDFKDALRAVHTRGKLMEEAVPSGEGSMAAVLGLDAEVIKESLLSLGDPTSKSYVACANFNGPAQTVIAGTKQGIKEAEVVLKEKGAKRVIELSVSAPFHCALMEPVALKMAEVLNAISFKDAKIPVISNVSAKPEKNGERIKDLLLKQIANPVRFTECVNNLLKNELAGSAFIELGPKNILSGIVKHISSSSLVMNIDGVDDLTKFDESRSSQ